MKGKMNKKSIIILIIVGVLALSALGSWFIWKNKHQPVVEGPIQEETDSDTAPILVLDYNNVSLGLDKSFTVQAKIYWKGEEIKEQIEYTWELDEDCSADIASMKVANDSATITGVAYGETAFKVSANYRGTLLVKKLAVYVSNIDVIFDSPNMELSAGCYTVNLGLLETETDITSMTPEIYVYDKEELVENPIFTWTNSDESIAIMDESGKITAKKAGTTLIVGKYKESELHIRVNVYRSKIEKSPVCIEEMRNYTLGFSDLRGMEVEDVRFNGESVLKNYNKSNGTIKFDSDKLPELGVTGELVIQTDKAEFIMKATVVTMAIHNEADLNKMASVITARKGEGYYALANDIKCTGVYDAEMDVEFVGTFDGLGNTIYNMTTSDRDGSNRGLLGSKMGATGVVRNVSFVNAKHSGNGGLIVTDAAGTIKNVYIQVDLEYSEAKVTSVLATYTFGVFSTENVLIEYMNPLPTDAVSGYALGQLWHGYAKHQGLYVIGANKVAGQIEDLGGGLKDVYGAYQSYGDFLDAGVDVKTWENDFWTVTNGIPYPTNLGTRTGSKPNVSIPEYISAGTTVTINGATIYDRIVLSSAMKKLGIKVSGDQLIVPENVPAGTEISLHVSSVFDASKKTTIATKVLETERITLPGIYNAETYKQTTFAIDFGSYASKVEGAELFYVAADGVPFTRMLYKNGILTLDNESPEGLGRKTVEATFKKGEKLIAFTISIDVCTMAVYDETDLKDMAAIITENEGAGRYVLGADIVCTETYDSNLGVPFTGSFDGHGYAIYNMTTSDRDAGNRGLLGATLADTAVVENVSFVNAKHGGKGGFIAMNAAGTIRNVYIQIDITGYNNFSYDAATSVLASSTYGVFSTENVLIEYTNPLPVSASNGYAVWQLWHGYGKHQGLYAIGANAVATSVEDLGGGIADVYGAYMSYADFADADVNVDSWKNDFWGIYNGIPYPKHLGSRAGAAPEVSIPKYVGAGASVVIDGLTMYDRVVLGSDMKALGITVKDGALHIPASVPRGTNVRITVESVFDSSKKTALQATVFETVNVTLENTYDVETYNRTTFDIDFGTQASAVDGGTLISATVGNTNFAKATYKEGVLTLDTSTLADFGKKVVTAVFDKDSRLVTVTINIDVSTMVIRSEEDLNNMTSVIIANNGTGRYVLGQDISCQGTYDSNSSAAFNGTFDGRGYAIYNMTTGDRDGGYRSLIGTLGEEGVIENVSFVNAKHGGQGGFITTSGQGKIRNVYVQIDITDYTGFGWDGATSVLASSTFGTFSTENVLVEYINSLPSDATTGYAIWEQYYGYAKHQGLYVVGADRVNEHEADLGGGLTDIYAAYRNYGDFVTAGNDLTTWANDFWTVTNGIPYPTNLGVREGEIPQVSIPAVVAPGSEVVIAGATMYDRVILAADAKELGIAVSNNVILVPETVPTGTTINLIVQSVFDNTKKVNLSTEILTSKNVSKEDVTTVEIYNNTTFQVDLTQLDAEIGEATLVSASVDGTVFVDASYGNGVLTLDTVSLSGYGEKTVSATFKGTGSLVSVTIPIDVCTMAIDSEEDLNNMTAVIAANNGKGRYILTSDITCVGTYDSNSSLAFNGVFDGCGYAIYNMTTSNRDGGYRSLIGLLGGDGVIENVSFINAKHGGQGGFITTNGQGKIRNVYVQIDITDYTGFGWDGATSVLASSTAGAFSTENVLVEYINPLPSDATTGYAIWEQYYGYAKHQGLYVVGADRVSEHEADLGGGQTDIYAAYRNYDDFLAAGIDLTAWENDFWTVTDGIPYPTKLGTREAVVPTVTIPETVEPGSNVVIEGVKVYERIVLDAAAQALGITVTGNVVNIPDSVALGTEVHLTVVSIFDTTKSTALTTTVNVQQDDEELKEITWTDFKLWEPLTFGTTFSSEACATYSGTSLNNTAFEGDVSIPSGSGFRYAVPSAWYGLTIKESLGKLLIGGDSYVALNGVNGTAYTLNAADYGLTTFTGERFTIRIELYNLSSDNLSATLNIYVNGKVVGEGITLTGSTVAATTYLGSGIGFVQNGLAGGTTIYDVE